MNQLKDITDKIGLPTVSQVGVVVRDVEKATTFYSDFFGLGPFTVYEFKPDRHWFMDEPSPLRLMMGKAMWGDVELELIEPLEGRSLHQEFLDSHGEGLQHLGFNVPDYETIFNRMVRAGFQPLMRAESYLEQYGGDLKACYFDTRRVGGVICEVIWKSWLPECAT
jgi:4-hydroxyphenylpyruvate dioxygenase-like putative hemolysin